MNEFTRELPAIGVFADLSEDSIEALASHGEFFVCEDRQQIIERGAFNDTFLFLIQGELEVYTEDHDTGEFLASVKPGESLGEINLFSPAAASASVYAVQRSLVWGIKYGEFEAFVESSPRDGNLILVKIIQELGQRIRMVNEKVGSGSSMQAAFYATC